MYYLHTHMPRWYQVKRLQQLYILIKKLCGLVKC